MPPPFFIVGSARSGSTLLRVIFNAHPAVAVPPESRFVTELWTGAPEVEVGDFLNRLGAHRQFRGWGLEIDAVRAELEGLGRVPYPRAVEAAYVAYMKRQGKSRWGDKTPRYVMHIPLLAQLFPNARFIHLIRDGRNVALSYTRVPFGPKTIPQVATLWAERVTTGARDGRALGTDRYMELRYEDLVGDLEQHAKTLCDFLDLAFDPAMLDYTEAGKKVVFAKSTRYNPHVLEKPQADIRSWETDMSDAQVKLFEATAGAVLEEFGYPRRYRAFDPKVKLMASLGRVGVPVGRLKREA